MNWNNSFKSAPAPENKAAAAQGAHTFSPDPDMYGRAVMLDIHISTDTYGEQDTTLIYVVAENTAFGINFLLPNSIEISHIVHVRYGNAFGGAAGPGTFVKKLMPLLKTRYYISDPTGMRAPDRLEEHVYPVLQCLSLPEFTQMDTIPGRAWSNCGDVTWYKTGCAGDR